MNEQTLIKQLKKIGIGNTNVVINKAKIIMKQSNIKSYEHFLENFDYNESTNEWESKTGIEIGY